MNVSKTVREQNPARFEAVSLVSVAAVAVAVVLSAVVDVDVEGNNSGRSSDEVVGVVGDSAIICAAEPSSVSCHRTTPTETDVDVACDGCIVLRAIS